LPLLKSYLCIKDLLSGRTGEKMINTFSNKKQ
jgi:hypothetical protein